MTGLNSTNQSSQTAGSPDTGEPVFLVIGKLRRPHGIRGEILMQVRTDFPDRLSPGVKVYIGEAHQPYYIHSRRWQQDALLVAFQGLVNREAVGELRNLWVYVRSDEIPDLSEGEYYHHDMIGLKVVDEAGKSVGVITEILESGAHDIFVVQAEDKREVLLPMIDSVVLQIDVKAGEMRVHILPGIYPDA